MRYIRRSRARKTALTALLLALALGAYVFTKLAFGGISGAQSAAPAPTEGKLTQSVALDAYSFYAIQFGAFDNDADARTLSQSYLSRGAAGYVLTDSRSRAIGAAYTSRQDADKVHDNLALQGIDSYVYAVSSPRVELRITAEKSLIDAIAAGGKCSLDSIAELGRIALEMDRQNLSVEQARAALSAAGARASAAYSTLSNALAGRAHAATGGILSELKAESDACAALNQQSSDSAIEFSGKIKYNVIDLMERHVQFVQMLIQPAASA